MSIPLWCLFQMIMMFLHPGKEWKLYPQQTKFEEGYCYHHCLSDRWEGGQVGVTLSFPEQNSNIWYSNTLYGLVVPFDSHIDICRLRFTKFGINIKPNYLVSGAELWHYCTGMLKTIVMMSKILQMYLLEVSWLLILEIFQNSGKIGEILSFQISIPKTLFTLHEWSFVNKISK